MSARRPWAWPLVPVYAAGLALKDGLRAAGLLRARKLAWPVVSVGSLSAGGAGKTPVVIALAEMLKQRGWHVTVLSRGYGRKGKGVAERVDGTAPDAALRFGDEPVLIAQRTGAEIWVGAKRVLGGWASEANAQIAPVERGVHLLDDGFQHRGLARALDVVVVTAEDLEDALLPAGNRRERLGALRRADVVVLREEERGRIEAQVRQLMRDDAAVWVVRRTVDFAVTDGLGRAQGLVAFCAIARPRDFVETLRTAGGRVVDSVAFPDHHVYTVEDIDRLTKARKASGGDAFVTTEKDAVKLTPELRARLEGAPLLVARLQAVFLNPDDVVRALEARLK